MRKRNERRLFRLCQVHLCLLVIALMVVDRTVSLLLQLSMNRCCCCSSVEKMQCMPEMKRSNTAPSYDKLELNRQPNAAAPKVQTVSMARWWWRK